MSKSTFVLVTVNVYTVFSESQDDLLEIVSLRILLIGILYKFNNHLLDHRFVFSKHVLQASDWLTENFFD